LSFYIWRRGAGQRILAGGEGRRSCGPQPPEPALPSTAPRQARIRAGPRRITLAAPSRAAVAAHFSFAFIRGFGPPFLRPATPGTSNTIDRAPAGPRRITLAAPSRAAVAAHFSFAFIRGFGPLNQRPSPPAIILGTAPRCQRPKAAPNVETPESAKRATEKAARFLARFAGLFRLLRTFPIPQGGTVGFLLSPASRASGAPFMNKESPFRSPCPPPFQAHSWIGKCGVAARRGSGCSAKSFML